MNKPKPDASNHSYPAGDLLQDEIFVKVQLKIEVTSASTCRIHIALVTDEVAEPERKMKKQTGPGTLHHPLAPHHLHYSYEDPAEYTQNFILSQNLDQFSFLMNMRIFRETLWSARIASAGLDSELMFAVERLPVLAAIATEQEIEEEEPGYIRRPKKSKKKKKKSSSSSRTLSRSQAKEEKERSERRARKARTSQPKTDKTGGTDVSISWLSERVGRLIITVCSLGCIR